VAFDLALDQSQEAVAEVFGRFFDQECPPAVVREAEPLGFSPALWAKLCELGAPGIGVAESVGGGGASMLDLAIVAGAAGRVLAPVPFVDHVVASRVHPDAAVVEGGAVAAIALRPAVDGVWRMVPAGAVADVVVGLDGDELVAVRGEAPGTGPRNHADMPIADRATTPALGTGERTVVGDRATFARALVEWKLLQAAQLAGLAARALEIAVEYVKDRSQFGRPVGGFQAVQHGLADVVGPVEGSRLLALKAAWALDEGHDGLLDAFHNDVEDPAALAAMAFAFAADTAALTTRKAVQYHGSYGVSLEYDIQLYFRRARGWPLVLGDPAHQHRELADLVWPLGA
jgi:alkylation response protein AidB-like acyl-CoA dehydrogenase